MSSLFIRKKNMVEFTLPQNSKITNGKTFRKKGQKNLKLMDLKILEILMPKL